MPTVPPVFLPLTCHFRLRAHCRRRLRWGPGLLRGGEGVGDALVGGIRLPVDAVRVDLQQDGDAVPGTAGDLSRRYPGVQPQRHCRVAQDAKRRNALDPREADEMVVLSVVGGTQPRGALP
jgi:hypothetical protein